MTFFVEGLTSSPAADRQVRQIGEYAAREATAAAAKRAIDMFLIREYQAGMPPAQFFVRYRNAGEGPIIFRDDDVTMNVSYFNHFEYALARCADMAGLLQDQSA